MKSIEVMRKELETAKKIKAAGGFCGNTFPEVKCIEDHCPGKNKAATVCFHWREHEWDAFISAREAELAEMEKAAEDRIPTLDDFALTLIQGGFSITEPGYDNGESIKALFSRAAAIKAESDRRRGI